jgi:hypothetical protein
LPTIKVCVLIYISMDIMGFIKSDTKVREGLVDACQFADG